MKKNWCPQNSRSASRDLYIFWIYLYIFIYYFRICVTDCKVQSAFCPTHPPSTPWAALKRPILNRVKKQNWTYLWINSLMFYTVCFYYITSWRLSKYMETNLNTTWATCEPDFKGTLMQIWKSANIFVFVCWKIICWKIICCRFYIKTPFTLWDMCTWGMWKVCLQTFKSDRLC